MIYKWGARKAAANERKHGVDFREAATVFDDPFPRRFPTTNTRYPNVGS